MTAELGRVRGVFIPTVEIEAHTACGWRVIDDLFEDAGIRDEVLMASPQVQEGEAA